MNHQSVQSIPRTKHVKRIQNVDFSFCHDSIGATGLTLKVWVVGVLSSKGPNLTLGPLHGGKRVTSKTTENYVRLHHSLDMPSMVNYGKSWIFLVLLILSSDPTRDISLVSPSASLQLCWTSHNLIVFNYINSTTVFSIICSLYSGEYLWAQHFV